MKPYLMKKNRKYQELLLRYSMLWLIFLVVICGCARPSETSFPWTHTRFLNNPAEFQFAIISDRNGGERTGVFSAAIDKLNLLRPEFVLCIGDLIPGGTEEKEGLTEQWKYFDKEVNRLDMPFCYMPGNHDIHSQSALEVWKQKHGNPYFHFIYKDVLFLFLDSEGGADTFQKGVILNDQIEYFRGVLQNTPSVRWTMIFIHKQLWESPNSGWEKFELLLNNRPYTVFAGHIHLYAYQTRKQKEYITLATTGGALEIPRLHGERADMIRLGSFDHIAWVTVTQEGPRIANLLLDGIYDEKVATWETMNLAEDMNDRKHLEYKIIPNPDSPDQASFQIILKNETAASLTMVGTFVTSSEISIEPETVDVSLAPGERKSMEATLKGLSSISADAPKDSLLIFQSTVTFQIPDFQPIIKNYSHPILLKNQ